MPAQILEIKRICDEFDIILIEDAAEALGSSFENQKLGTFGHFGVFSFNGNKIITTSGGGALVSINKDWIDKARFLSTQARDPAPHYQHSEIGYNYRMSNVLAGIGRGQLEVLNSWICKRRENFSIYKKNMNLKFQTEPKGYFSNRWLTTCLFDTEKIRDSVRIYLLELNIESRPLWKPMHMQPIFNKYPSFTNGVSEDLFIKGLCLPSGSNLEKKHIIRVIGGIKSITI